MTISTGKNLPTELGADSPPRVTSRLWERDFWIVQGGVLLVTIVHGAVEVVGGRESQLSIEMGSLVVIAYLIPVTYAGIRYGMEGGLLTGVLAAALSLPNLLFYHDAGYAWLGELGTVLVIISVGVVVGYVVERERRARSEAEATSGRLALLNRVTAALTRHGDADRLLADVLTELEAGLDLAGVGFSAPATSQQPVMSGDITVGNFEGGAEVVRLPVHLDETDFGVLMAAPRSGDTLSATDHVLLQAVAREVGVALENVRLHASERKGLQDYVLAVTRAQEDERKRIARELHDDAAQSLVLLSRGLGRMVSGNGLSAQQASEAENLREMVGGILESVRRASRDLRPAVLDDLGLAPALEWLAGQMTDLTGIEATFAVSGTRRRLQPDEEVAAFRIAQEALRNIEKHSDSDAVAITLAFQDRRLELRVTDNGRGFDPTAATGRTKLGLVGMRERAELVGGSLTIDSRLGHGTTVTFEFTQEEPLPLS